MLSWGRNAEQISEILEMKLSKVLGIIKGLRETRTLPPSPKQPRTVTNAIRKVDAEIQFHEHRARDLRRYRAQLAEVHHTQEALVQEIRR